MIFGRTPVFFLPCCVIIASLSGVVAKPPEPPETPDLSEKKATTYLAAYGYLNTTSHHITKNDLKEALLKFQSFMDLPKTGELDREVRETMLLIRCGVSDRPVEGSIDSRIWHKSILTWNISSFPETIPESEVRETAHNAFSTWEKALSINFLETSQGRHADIVINFLEQAPEGSHDITGNAVAETVGARIFLRRDHQWNIFPKDSAIDSSNLFQAFLHEIGHVLGLHHSHETNSVMYPIFTQTNGKSDLSASDVEAVRGLYGVVQGTAELSPGSTEKERKCPKSLNAVMQANNQHIFVFKGDHFWKFKNQKVVQGPLPLHQVRPPSFPRKSCFSGLSQRSQNCKRFSNQQGSDGFVRRTHHLRIRDGQEDRTVQEGREFPENTA
ncbi:hypothetical protein L596_003162 [Steinernema carpocapsae]|uniref:Peptidase metallopeptidase domain-containing protein n=1 Tax=Steinernema carpocapsae TaxID=34508 RepID=A0A4U8URV2_STECR|nr:hypothetical protein L596_003162 [Steinernema carpocapsae]